MGDVSPGVEDLQLPTLLCRNRHPVEKLKIKLRRHQGLVAGRKCNLCGAAISRHESHWRCEHHCDYNVCQDCFGAHWRASLAEAAEADSPRGSQHARLLRALPAPLRGCGLYAEIAGRWGLDVPHPLGLVLHRVWNVPGHHGESDLSVLVEALDAEQACLAKAQSYIVSGLQDPVWDTVLTLPSQDPPSSCTSPSPGSTDAGKVSPGPQGSGVSETVNRSSGESANAAPEQWDLERTSMRFTLLEVRTLLPTLGLGQCVVPLVDLLKRPSSKWMLFDDVGNAALGAVPPHMPCELNVSVVQESMPSHWPRPRAATKERASYPHHAFLMTRGTRGDVQPFVALARGLAERLGWLVTVCTEMRWRPLVRAHANVERGRIQFRPSGGDTEARLQGRAAQLLLRSRHEMFQMLILSHSQEQCFPSASVFVHHVLELEKEPKPVDLVIFGLTVIELAVLVSQYCQKALIGFILQPSIIPSKDERWTAVAPIPGQLPTRGGGLLHRAPGPSVTSHESLRLMKELVEHNPFVRWNIDFIRRLFGLEPLDTWAALREQNVPLIVPMKEGTFQRPSDWWEGVQLTDFIFLRSDAGKRAAAPPPPPPPPPRGLDDEAGGQRQQLEEDKPALAPEVEGEAVAPPAQEGKPDLPPEVEAFLAAALRAPGAHVGLMSFSSMPVPRKVVLQCATKMVEECRHNLRLIYVGRREEGPADLEAKAARLKEEGRFLEVEHADFGALFPRVDCFIVHGGLGTTVEALRRRKPICVTGPLLLDQRFWGAVCFDKGVGPEPVHVEEFEASCVAFADGALDPADPRGWQRRARELQWAGGNDDDGVAANVDHIARLMARGVEPLHQRG